MGPQLGSVHDDAPDGAHRPQPPDSGVSVIGVVLLVISALSFTRALQRLDVRAWRLDKLGVRGNLWGLRSRLRSCSSRPPRWAPRSPTRVPNLAARHDGAVLRLLPMLMSDAREPELVAA
jgi:hypothetical protein